MQSGISVREAEVGDANHVLAIKRDAIKDLPRDAYRREQLEAWAPDAGDSAAFEAAIRADRYVVLVAELEDRTVGYGVLTPDEGRIDAVFVDPDYARRGVATVLLDHLEARAERDGREALTLAASLNAVPFYESAGYERRGTEVREINGVEMEWALMGKSLGD